MQASCKDTEFKLAFGEIIRELRKTSTNCSMNNFAREYGFDRGNLSNLEHGKVGCNLATAWKLAEALGIKFSALAVMLEDKLGDEFKYIDE